jgi:hypothetical protein
VRSVDLERLIAEGVTMIVRRIAVEVFLDDVPDLFKAHIGTAWKPRTRSRANHRNYTASVIREFTVAKRRAEIEPLVLKGPKTLSPAALTSAMTARSGMPSIGSSPNTLTCSSWTVIRPKGRSSSHRAGPTRAMSRK